ncbi:phosphatase 2C-like domain-containing protein [Fimicolochytrium jonesii]|uniref:phosphatase 2C-like domain-containing protein n=1 Tax=Fimicolochytrium jonesii TaxID=1396493 RepID=UPI0022FDF2E6|nr:phosphatase 2C-like domain-containing protein [Fimicolochytrium jonesii]KAI8825927.1 phosphatase 2C-like domain-containing protein [Fimicolochytrium jonesii]
MASNPRRSPRRERKLETGPAFRSRRTTTVDASSEDHHLGNPEEDIAKSHQDKPGGLRVNGELALCAQNMRALGLTRVVERFADEVARYLELPDELKPLVLDFGRVTEPPSKDAVERTSALRAVYQCLRSYEAFNTIDIISKTFETLDQLGDRLKETKETWQSLRDTDWRTFVPEDLDSSCILHSSSHETTARRIQWASAGRLGWWDDEDGNPNSLHDDLEDVVYMPRSIRAFRHKHTGQYIRIFCVADGHGGRCAAAWFAERVPGVVMGVCDSRTCWDLSQPADEQYLREQLTNAIMGLDDAFCEIRKQEYMHAQTLVNRGNGTDLQISDDGCTLSVLILFADSHLVTAHVGDSRIVIAKESTSDDAPCTLIHTTMDHSVSHPIRAQYIAQQGGVFRISKRHPEVKLPASSLVPANQPPSSVPLSHIDALATARVFRPQSFINPYGFPIKHMGMGDAMGDVVMKVEPRLFMGRADVDVVRLDPGCGYVVVMATDGLWAVLGDAAGAKAASVDVRTEAQTRRVVEEWPRFAEGREAASAMRALKDDQMGAVGCKDAVAVKSFAQALCDRHQGPLKALFIDEDSKNSSTRKLWDDIAVVVISIEPAEAASQSQPTTSTESTNALPSQPGGDTVTVVIPQRAASSANARPESSVADRIMARRR